MMMDPPYPLYLSLWGVSFHSLTNTTSPALPSRGLCNADIHLVGGVLGVGEKGGNHGARKRMITLDLHSH